MRPPYSLRHQKGNALFLILIAVALFAALSYAVTRSGRGTGSIDKEQSSLTTAGLMSYSSTVQSAVSRMMLVNRCSETALSFYSTRFTTPGNYGSAPAPDDSCYVFYPGGGGVTWQAPPGQPEFLVTGTVRFTGVGTDNLGNDSSDLAMIGKVSRSTCLAVNKLEGIPTSGGSPPSRAGDGFNIPINWIEFTGSYGNWMNTDSLASLYGHNSGCWQSTDNGDYNYYFILLAR